MRSRLMYLAKAPAGEMKHGPIALLEEGSPVVVIAPNDHLKTASPLLRTPTPTVRVIGWL